jgi:hypothetical protein
MLVISLMIRLALMIGPIGSDDLHYLRFAQKLLHWEIPQEPASQQMRGQIFELTREFPMLELRPRHLTCSGFGKASAALAK